MSKVEDLVAALRAEATEVARGGFTLDEEAARRRLAESRYSDRDAYLSPTVEGLLGLGAPQLEVHRSGADIVLDALGTTVENPEQALRGLFSAAFAETQDKRTRALARLAVAMDMALGHAGIEGIVIELADAEERWAGVLEVDKPFRFAKLESYRPGMRVLFDRGLKHEALALFDREAPPELHALSVAVHRAPDPIYVESELASTTPPCDAAVSAAGDGFRIRAGYEKGRTAPRIVWMHQGVIAQTTYFEEPDDPGGFVAYVELEVARRDASRMRLLQDEVYRRAEARAHALYEESRALLPPPPQPPPKPKPEPKRQTLADFRQDPAPPSSSPGVMVFGLVFMLAGVAMGAQAFEGRLVIIGLFMPVIFGGFGGMIFAGGLFGTSKEQPLNAGLPLTLGAVTTILLSYLFAG